MNPKEAKTRYGDAIMQILNKYSFEMKVKKTATAEDGIGLLEAWTGEKKIKKVTKEE